MDAIKPNAPPRVPDVTDYWQHPPPAQSDRCSWWLKRIRGGWRRNRRIHAMGYHEAAEYFGVYIWEWLRVISPLLTELESESKPETESKS